MLIEEELDRSAEAYAGRETFSLGRGGGLEDVDVVAEAFEEDGCEEAGAGPPYLVGLFNSGRMCEAVVGD